MDVKWVEIPGYEGYYEASSDGQIRSVARTVTRKDGVKQNRIARIKKQTENKDGYLTVNLSKNGVQRRFRVHRLIAAAFALGPIDMFEVDHIDFNRKNNCVENLRLLSHIDNIRHTKSHGRHVSDSGFCGENNPNFGNRKLSKKYRNDPQLAKEKQSRPGAKNGRARAVSATIDGSPVIFGCMSDCAKFLVKERIVKGKDINGISTHIRIAAESGGPYCGTHFSFI